LIRIEEKALYGRSLRSVCIPASVEILERECFSGCRLLASVTFESGAKMIEINWRAFSKCSSLESIRIPASVNNIDSIFLTMTVSLRAEVFRP
jgi:hypothetical protein